MKIRLFSASAKPEGGSTQNTYRVPNQQQRADSADDEMVPRAEAPRNGSATAWHATCSSGLQMRSDRSKHRSAWNIYSVLVLARPSSDTEDLLEPLLRRSDIGLFRVATVDAAQIALCTVGVSLVLVGAETEAAMVTSMLDATDQLRPKTPVLLLRGGESTVSAGWREGLSQSCIAPFFQVFSARLSTSHLD